jgi:hypothetical protein
MNLNDIVSYSGWIFTVVGVLFAVYQYRKMKKLVQRDQEQLSIFIEDANYVSFEHELIDEIALKINDPMLTRFLVSCHQRGSDLYRALVDFYLSKEEHFDYEDLKRICETPLITYKWQEVYWKGRVALRAENRNKEVPKESYLQENKLNRFKAYEKRESLKLAGDTPNKSMDVRAKQ